TAGAGFPLSSEHVFGIRMPLKQVALYEQVAQIFTDSSLRKPAKPDVAIKIAPPLQLVPKGSGQRILIADDSSVNQQVAANMVARLGFQSDVVANGWEAVKAVENGSYALVLMDCQMPEMDGFEATHSIRSLPHGKGKIPILAVTANALSDYSKLCFDAGMDDVIVKPIVLDDLRTAFSRWLAESEINPRPAARSDPRMTHVKPSPKVSSTAIDPRVLEAFFQGSAKESTSTFVDELIDLFLDIVPPIIGHIHDAVQAREARALERHAHKLKGTSRNLGARDLAASCEILEELGSRNNLEGASDVAALLSQQFEAAKLELLNGYRSSTRDRPKLIS
ncbi:MAG: response regulator, partial [Pseudobdellovibrionaceae bacterium]|nr:response regulator [Pseudobdellovibrionaceae bacterium]